MESIKYSANDELIKLLAELSAKDACKMLEGTLHISEHFIKELEKQIIKLLIEHQLIEN